MDGTALKTDRILKIYSQLVNGDILRKKELAQQFHVTERSIQRDMEALRCFFCRGRAATGYHLRPSGKRLPAGESLSRAAE